MKESCFAIWLDCNNDSDDMYGISQVNIEDVSTKDLIEQREDINKELKRRDK
mgnify:CR=1 FL=1